MDRNRPVFVSLVAVLLATVAFQGREQHRVLVAGDRTAAIELRGTEGAEGLSGDLEAGVDLAAGSSALRADLRLEDAGELDDGTVDAFLEASGNATEAIGAMDVPVPAEQEDASGGLDAAFRSAVGGGESYATMDLEMAAPSDEPASPVTLQGTVEGTPDSVSGAVDYTVTVSEDRAGRIPVTDLSLTLADEVTGSEGNETVVTTLTLSVTAPEGSGTGRQLRQLSGARATIEQQLQQSGLQVETFEVSAVEETADGVTVDATVAVRGLRQALSGFIGLGAMGMAGADPAVDPQALVAPLAKMTEVRIHRFELTTEVSGREVSGRVSGEVSRLERFFDGYTELLRAAMRSGEAAREDTVPDELSPYATAFREATLELTARSFDALTGSDLSFAAEGDLIVSAAGDTTTVDGGFDLTVDGYRDYAEKARAADIPVPDTALIAADVHLTDAGRLEGEYYSYSDIDLLANYTSLFVATLERVEGAEEAASLLEETRLEEAALSADLDGRDLTVRGYSRTTPLTDVARALLREVEPEVEGTPEGARLDYALRPDGTGEGALRLYFSDFMPNRSAAEIRTALGLPDGAEVAMDAAPDAVAPTRVERPEVEVSADLDDVRTSARELAARGPGDGDGPSTWMLIAGGVLVLALLAVGWTAARQGSRV